MAKEGFDYEKAKAEVGDQFPPPEHLSEQYKRLWTGAAAVLMRNAVEQYVSREIKPLSKVEIYKHKKAS